MEYRAFCAGNIITEQRALTSANCFLTNRKRLRHNLNDVRVVAGILYTSAKEPASNDVQQWREVDKISSQRFYRFPAYDLAIVEVKRPWVYNQFVKNIPYASLNQNFDGVCMTTSVKPTKSWSKIKFVFTEYLQLMTRRQCGRTLLRSCRLYLCTKYNHRTRYTSSETQGGGLICHGKGDPEEKDDGQGLLVGVTSLINIGLPSLHTRVGLFHEWISSAASQIVQRAGDVCLVFCVLFALNKLLI